MVEARQEEGLDGMQIGAAKYRLQRERRAAEVEVSVRLRAIGRKLQVCERREGEHEEHHA